MHFSRRFTIPVGSSRYKRCLGLVLLAICLPEARADNNLSWTGPTGDWTDASDWSSGGVISPNFPNNGTPVGVNYTADINNPVGSYTVSLSTSVSVDKLTVDSPGATLFQTAGTLSSVQAVLINNGTYDLDGGQVSTPTITLSVNGALVADGANPTLGPTTGLQILGGNGDNLGDIPTLYAGGANSPVGGATLTLASNLLVAGSLNINDGAAGTDTVVNNGEIDSAGINNIIRINTDNLINNSSISANSSGFLDVENSGTFTNQGTVSVNQNSLVDLQTTVPHGTTINLGTMSVGTISQLTIGGTLLNSGTIDVGNTGPFASLTIGNGWTNTGLITNTNLSAIYLGAGTNSGTISVNFGSSLDIILGNGFTDTGTIVINSGSIAFDGTYGPADVQPLFGKITVAPGNTAYLVGTLNNAGSTLDLSAVSYAIGIKDATVNDGTILVNSTTGLNVYSGAEFNAVTVTGGNVNVNNGGLDILGGMTLDPGRAIILNGADITMDGSAQSLDNMTIQNSPSQSTTQLYVGGTDSTAATNLTLGPGFALIGAIQVLNGPLFNGCVLLNSGLIESDAKGNTPDIETSRFINSGTFLIQNGGSGTIGSSAWSNLGTISVAGGSTLNLGGTFTIQNFGTLQLAPTSNLVFVGTLNNGNTNLNLPALGVGVYLNQGDIHGGTVTEGGNASLDIDGQGILKGVAVTGGNLDVGSGGNLYIQSGLTMDAGRSIFLNGGDIYFEDSTPAVSNYNIQAAPSTLLFGTTEILLGGPSSTGPTSLTIGGAASLQGVAAIATFNYAASTLINDGLVNADTASGSLLFTTTLINNGTLEAENLGSLVINASFTNHGFIQLGGATLSSQAALDVGNGTLEGSGAIDGSVTLDSDPSTLDVLIGGRTQGTNYSFLHIYGDATLGGDLDIAFANGFQSSILPTDTFQIMLVDSHFLLTGAFANVPNGARLATTDDFGSFQVNYGSGSFANEILLSNFQAVPEPAALGLLATAAAAALRRRRLRFA